MKTLTFLFIAMAMMILSPYSVYAEEFVQGQGQVQARGHSLCKQELVPLQRSLKSYMGNSEHRRQLISAYYQRREAIAATCSPAQQAALDAKFRPILRQSGQRQNNYTYVYTPRKTVEIGTIYFTKPTRR